MTRRTNDGVLNQKEAGCLWALLFVGPALGSLFAAVVKGAILTITILSLSYGAILVAPLLWLAYWRAERYAKLDNQECYENLLNNYVALTELRSSSESRLRELLRKTQSGAFDERSSLGREANQKLCDLDIARSNVFERLSDIVKKDRWDAFFRAANIIFVSVFVWLSVSSYGIFLSSSAAMAASLSGAYIWKAIKSIGSSIPAKPPMKSIVWSLVSILIWGAGATFAYFEILYEDNIFHAKEFVDESSSEVNMENLAESSTIGDKHEGYTHPIEAEDCGRPYPCRLEAVIDYSDWQPVLSALAFGMQEDIRTPIRWTSDRSEHSGYVQREDIESIDYPNCKRFNISLDIDGRANGVKAVVCLDEQSGAFNIH